MRLVIVTNKKEKSIEGKISRLNCEHYGDRDFLDRLYKGEFLSEDTYILLAFREKELLSFLEKRILKAGILRKQIIYISEWDGIRTDEMKVVEKYIYDSVYYDGVLIGMSHLKDGVMLKRMRGNYIKIGIPSIDLFYISRIIQLMVDEDKLDGCKQMIFELPYYMFNWDISKSTKMAERFHIAYYLGEYHHFGEDEVGQVQLRHLLMFNDAMKLKMIQHGDYADKRFGFALDNSTEQSFFQCLLKGIRELPNQRKLCEKKYSIWSKLHLDTIEENQNEWRKIVALLTQKYPTMKIFVAVFPHNPYFRKCHADEIKGMRSVFYRAVKYNNKIQMLDYFDYYLPFCCFSDECHLNELGAHIFSGVLNTELQKQQ